MALNQFFDWVFGPVVNNFSARWGVIAISFIITLFITLVYKFFTDQRLLKATKDEMKVLQQEIKKFKEDPAKMLQLNQEVMRKNAVVMKNSLKPLIITMIPVLLIFSWLRVTFKDNGDLLSIFGLKFGWLGTYVISSIIFSIILRKILKVH